MSQLVDAIRGVLNAAEPLPGLVTGGQPTLEHLTAFKRAGGVAVLDIRDPMEPQPFRTPEDVTAAGLEYRCIPVSAATRTDATLAAVRAAVQGAIGKKALLFYCNSGNRVGATLIPYLMLDRGMDEESATELAMQCGLRSAEQLEWALDYVHRQQGTGEQGDRKGKS